MSSRYLKFYCVLMLTASVAAIGCNREKREFPKPSAGPISDTLRVSALQPALARSDKPESSSSSSGANTSANPSSEDTKQPADYYKKYEGNGYAVSQGKRLYHWYNCSGCHAAGGGGSIGPALRDDKWLYGGQPNEIYATIRQGRPNGMPSFAGHISNDQIWQLVAYVRSMSGQLRTDVAPNRDDSLYPDKPETRREQEPMSAAPKKDDAS